MKSHERNTSDIQSKEHYMLVKSLSYTKAKDFVNIFIGHLKEQHNLSNGQIAALFEKKVPSQNLLPISIFNNKELGSLETVVKYLKEELGLRFHEIALMLNRNDRTIWATYKIACKKRKEKLLIKDSKIFIPASILKDRKFSVLEIIIGYLKENFNLRFSEIAILLNRNQRNIWATYSRYKKKK